MCAIWACVRSQNFSLDSRDFFFCVFSPSTSLKIGTKHIFSRYEMFCNEHMCDVMNIYCRIPLTSRTVPNDTHTHTRKIQDHERRKRETEKLNKTDRISTKKNDTRKLIQWFFFLFLMWFLYFERYRCGAEREKNTLLLKWFPSTICQMKHTVYFAWIQEP